MDRQFSETKTVQVRNDPEVIDRVNARNSIFFWAVQSTQITDTKNTSFSRVGDTLYQEVEHTNYATITYTRDKTMPRYEEVTAIEKQLEQKEMWRAEANDVSLHGHIKFRIIACISAVIAIVNFGAKGGILTGIIFALISAGMIYLGIRKKKQAQLEFNEKTERWTSSPTIDELLQQAKALNNEIIQSIRNSKYS